ncbi:MAG: recombination-associated protein RdgC [Plesiomonas sp.]|uniref:recombination-associated protein RdgC n=1 Tax=Plesiomonas sp. TaxID=2486279 RepID=UPI003F367105
MFSLFKNAITYQLTRHINITENQLQNVLTDFAFSPCKTHESSRSGWSMRDKEHADIYVHDGNYLITMVTEKKTIPARVVKDVIEVKKQAFEVVKERKPSKLDVAIMKEQAFEELIPRAFSKTTRTQLWLDMNNGLVVVDSASSKIAEDALALLRKTIGSLPVIPANVQNPIELTLTEWVRSGDVPAGFNLLEEAELKSILEDGGVIRCKQQDLVCDEIIEHINADKYITKLAIEWQGRINFILSYDLSIKRLKFADDLRDQNDDIDSEDPEHRMAADFILMVDELGSMTRDVFISLGNLISPIVEECSNV